MRNTCVALSALLLAPLAALHAAEDRPAGETERNPRESLARLPAKTLDAIHHCRDQIARLQLPDGAFRFAAEDRDRVRIVPYFGNVAARALLVAQAIEPDENTIQRAERWIDWYASHVRADGTILDFVGTSGSYAPSTKRDSIDTYPPSYLATLWWFWTTCSRAPNLPRERILSSALLALDAIERSIDPSDGLAWASVPHRVKYAMDNLEVCIGLTEGERLLAALGSPQELVRARRMRERCQVALVQFWLPDKGYLAFAKGSHQMSISFEKPYPDGVVNLFAAGCMEPPRKQLWDNLQHQFASNARLTPDMWLAAARRCGLNEEATRYHQMCVAAASEEHLNIERAARLLIALAGEAASPVTVRLGLSNATLRSAHGYCFAPEGMLYFGSGSHLIRCKLPERG